MEKAKKVMIWFLVISVLVIALLFAVYRYQLTHQPVIFDKEQTILYYGFDCPHCKIVEEFIAKENISSKLVFSQKEVWLNQTNQNEMKQAVKICKLNLDQVGVPFLYANQKCYMGDVDVIKFFKTELNITEKV